MIEHFYNLKQILLLGDFNAKTKLLNDIPQPYIQPDEPDLPTFVNHLDSNIDDLFNINKISLQRLSQDISSPNNYGHRLIDFCLSSNFFILNGRCGLDKNIGKTTCNDKTVIDYALLTYDSLEQLCPSIYVHDFSVLLSDVHCALTVTLTLKNERRVATNENDRRNEVSNETEHQATNNTMYSVPVNERPKRWDNSKASDFISSINIRSLDHVDNLLTNYRLGINDIDRAEQINNIVLKISEVLVEAAFESHGKIKPGMRTSNTQPNEEQQAKTANKEWFTEECSKARTEYRRAKSISNNSKNPIHRIRVQVTSRHYKRSMNKAINNYRFKISRDLKRLRKSDSNIFWNIIKNNTQTHQAIPIPDRIFNFYKNASYDESHEHNERHEQSEDSVVDDLSPTDSSLNIPISYDEVAKAIDKLKNGKSGGEDNIINEYIKLSSELLINRYVNLFNLILSSGVYPRSWTLGTIIPIYKNKGDIEDPANYRPITLSSCLAKLFSLILNERLTNFLKTNDTLNQNQGAFLPGTSTINHIFSLHCLITYFQNKKQPLFCAFLDLARAYDTVWRYGMFSKLAQSNITGNFLNIVKAMYRETKATIRCNNLKSEIYTSNMGIKQGCNLSCLLFALYLNDLEEYLLLNNCKGVELIDSNTGNIMLKLFILLYADDSIVLSNNKKDMQNALNVVSEYCTRWKLKINAGKTKVVVFGRDRRCYNFSINGQPIEKVKNFKYLGITFCNNGRFVLSIKNNTLQARKAAFAIARRSMQLGLSISCQLHLINTIIKPILLYGCEIFCFEKIDMIEKCYIQCIKNVLKVNKTTPSYMIYSELGLRPIEIDVMDRALSFFVKTRINVSLANKMLHVLSTSNENAAFVSRYLQYIYQSLDSLGLTFLHTMTINNCTAQDKLIKQIKQRITDQYIQKRETDLRHSRKGTFYRTINNNFKLPPYIDALPPRLRISLTRFRLSNHKLPIERGRWTNTDLQDRVCPFCTQPEIGDEHHFLFVCPHFNESRTKFLKKRFYTHPNSYKTNALFNTDNTNCLINLTKFIQTIVSSFP